MWWKKGERGKKGGREEVGGRKREERGWRGKGGKEGGMEGAAHLKES